ncbi:phage minor head protein [Brevibacillus porteri]|uniref:phage minor head protein n=1 Tax=Brevibacillus porteri TaxID=2126350 RepID=UPI001FC9D48F|nr:phage minor head protein [Brevibacillus porteri]MED1801354.1 phage minor head protein [Brevibacillus porteri]MED2135061.1 phage minor head protein [Brevibacillus porteri]MED2747371.1 phage minor head protein [Brevibacillus porteri]MED2813451.1 phage minor head protein [Brevibacillus porteri]MED2894757.1 phage minor head protein [Brevibacillus porteri]
MTRAVTVSRTLSTAAANGGKLEGWKQSGLVKKKRWRAANNKRTRKDHKDANGQEVDIDKPFNVGGEKMMYPGDPAGSAKQIVQCRCTMQAIM